MVTARDADRQLFIQLQGEGVTVGTVTYLFSYRILEQASVVTISLTFQFYGTASFHVSHGGSPGIPESRYFPK